MARTKVTPDEFQLFKKYIYESSGIALESGKEYLLETRLNVLIDKYECTTFRELHRKSKSDISRKMEDEIIDAISTNETYFFRDKTPFELLQHKILPDLIDKRSKNSTFKPSLRLWSAASSTGQEIYSIAMTLDGMGISTSNYNIKLLGTDISDSAVAQASYGSYNKFEVSRGLEPQKLRKYFDETGDKWRINDQIRIMVQFKKLNLMKPFSDIGKFDIILCRNVMIYFTLEDRKKIYTNLARALEPDGYLLIGSTESLTNVTDIFQSKRYLNSTFYQFK
ncbi:MAG: protein-glutamate O-methyltransferase CheR [Desulfobacteraceae bacterium]|nr:protein-glutamate O-methyltransferase CheR [Desulfobacteraceae bacterium]